MFDGVLFDLDGTLWEVENCTYNTANEIAKKYNLKPVEREAVKKGMGLTAEDNATLYFPELSKEDALLKLEESGKLNIEKLNEIGGHVYSNLENTLKFLKQKKYKIAIVSNTFETSYIEAFLNSSKLGYYFDDYLAAGKEKITKAEGIKKVIERNNIQNAIYVGDTIKDQESAKEAGIEFIYAKYGFGKDVESEIVINSIEELPKVLESKKNLVMKIYLFFENLGLLILDKLRLKFISNFYREHLEGMRYLVCGGLSTVINIVSYYLATDLIFRWIINETLKVNISDNFAFIIALIFAYIVNKTVVFETKCENYKSLFKEIFSFTYCRLFTQLISLGMMNFAVIIHMNDKIMKILANIVVIIVNFILSKLIIFKKVDKQ